MKHAVLMASMMVFVFGFADANAQPVSTDCEETKAQLTRAQTKLNDWPALARYHEANSKITPSPGNETRVVFMGDSITDR